jgi:hypothetical protein
MKQGGWATRRSNRGRLAAFPKVILPRAPIPSPLLAGSWAIASRPAIPVYFLSIFLLTACGPLVRPYYNRDIGGYLTPDPSFTPTPVVPAALKGSASAGDALRKAAEAYLGVPYRFGGQSRSGMDCSGFIRQVFSEVYGLRLPHNSSSIHGMGRAVSRSDLRIGDVVFFKRLGFIDHSGIYMGANYFIHSASSVGVSYSALDAPYFGSHYAGARRLIEAP